MEPSGLTYNYFGCAIGKGKQPAKVEIEKLKLGELTCREVFLFFSGFIFVFLLLVWVTRGCCVRIDARSG